tara:strand:- start:5506 stop:6012 length:507 start_codon:yes stop_codon:yes gene_type:complete
MPCVYLLEDCEGNGYIGITIDLNRRLWQHKRNSNDTNSKLLIKPFNHVILEEIDDEDDLAFAEQFYIKLYRVLYGNKLLNMMTPLQTNKEYRLINKDGLADYQKEYRLINKDELADYQKEYIRINKDKIAEYQKEKITCECGAIITKSVKARHERSAKHKNFLISKDN